QVAAVGDLGVGRRVRECPGKEIGYFRDEKVGLAAGVYVGRALPGDQSVIIECRSRTVAVGVPLGQVQCLRIAGPQQENIEDLVASDLSVPGDYVVVVDGR